MNRIPVPDQLITDIINTYPVSKLLPIARKVASTDYAVRYYYNPRHKKFYKNTETLRHAMRRVVFMGFPSARERLIRHFNLEDPYAEAYPEKYVEAVRKIGWDRKEHRFSLDKYIMRRCDDFMNGDYYRELYLEAAEACGEKSETDN